MKKIVILGSTGNVGKKALEVISKYRDRFQVVGLGANRNFRLLLKQAKEFKVRRVSIREIPPASKLAFSKPKEIEVLEGKNGLIEILNQKVDLLVLSMAGPEAAYPLLYAIEREIDLALANKEAIIAIGEIVSRKLKKSKSRIIPLDSEHNAIFQILNGLKQDEISRIFLTCSGGPFLNYTSRELEEVTPEMALAHPKWKMGKKITVDSATLMNKGFELIEAHYIFQLPAEKIKILIHPQALIHGMVELQDGTIIAEMAPTDMKMAISYALGYPERLDLKLRIDWSRIDGLTLQIPDEERFPAFKIARKCLKLKKSFPAYLVKADEIFVEAFLNGKIKFTQILQNVQKALQLHKGFEIKDLNSLEKVFREAEETSYKILGRRESL